MQFLQNRQQLSHSAISIDPVPHDRFCPIALASRLLQEAERRLVKYDHGSWKTEDYIKNLNIFKSFPYNCIHSGEPSLITATGCKPQNNAALLISMGHVCTPFAVGKQCAWEFFPNDSPASPNSLRDSELDPGLKSFRLLL